MNSKENQQTHVGCEHYHKVYQPHPTSTSTHLMISESISYIVFTFLDHFLCDLDSCLCLLTGEPLPGQLTPGRVPHRGVKVGDLAGKLAHQVMNWSRRGWHTTQGGQVMGGLVEGGNIGVLIIQQSLKCLLTWLKGRNTCTMLLKLNLIAFSERNILCQYHLS
jgi:hypothetical protein